MRSHERSGSWPAWAPVNRRNLLEMEAQRAAGDGRWRAGDAICNRPPLSAHSTTTQPHIAYTNATPGPGLKQIVISRVQICAL